jgi:microcystin-dependent protein
MNLLDFWMGMTGVVLPFAGGTAPSGWLLCYGQSLLRSDYPELFAAIGTTYGSADGTHFNVPDLRGRYAAGKDNMGGTAASRLVANVAGGITASDGQTLGKSGGVATHTLTAAELPAHQHYVGVDSGITQGAGVNRIGSGGGATTSTAEATSVNAITSAVGSDAAHNNLPPLLVLNYIIKA